MFNAVFFDHRPFYFVYHFFRLKSILHIIMFLKRGYFLILDFF